METIPVRRLRNEVSRVMAEVEAGATFRVSVSGRPVAELTPIGRPSTAPGAVFRDLISRAAADLGLASELADALQDTTDDVA